MKNEQNVSQSKDSFWFRAIPCLGTCLVCLYMVVFEKETFQAMPMEYQKTVIVMMIGFWYFSVRFLNAKK